MLISDKIVASYVEGFSGVYIYCNSELMEKIADDFEEMFENAWTQAMDDAEEDYDAVCQEKEDEIDPPAFVARKDGWLEHDRIHIVVGPLYLSMNYGARADNEFGINALEDTLKHLKEKYPEIRYEGLLAYEYCDEHAGDVVNQEICSEELPLENSKTYDFVGDILNTVLCDDDISEVFWEKMGDQLDDADEDDFEKILTDFRTYKVSQESLDKLMELGDEYDLISDDSDDDEED